MLIDFYIARPTYCFILMYTCGLTVVIKRICYVILCYTSAACYWLRPAGVTTVHPLSMIGRVHVSLSAPYRCPHLVLWAQKNPQLAVHPFLQVVGCDQLTLYSVCSDCPHLALPASRRS